LENSYLEEWDWENKTDLRETSYEDMNWTEVVQDHVQWQALVISAVEASDYIFSVK
jgi:hypothetical protein